MIRSSMWRYVDVGMKRLFPDYSTDQVFPDAHAALMDRLIRAGKVFAVVAAVVQTAIHTVNAIVTSNTYFSVNAENNPIAWSHGVAIFASAFVCALAALLHDDRRRTYIALAVILSFLSLDEIVYIHERVAAQVIDILDLAVVWDSVLWPVVYLPLCATLAYLLASVVSTAPRQAGQLIVVGLGCLLTAVFLEVASASLSIDESRGDNKIEGAFEEAAEIAGWISIATGLTAITLSRTFSPRHDVKR